MLTLPIILLSIIQGLTEFLPISSSGHLLLAQWLFGWQMNGIAFEIAVHTGSLAAIMLFFWRDVWAMTCGFIKLLTGQHTHAHATQCLNLIVATLPVIIMGLAAYDSIKILAHHPWILAINTLLFGLLLGYADRWHAQQTSTATQPSLKQSFYIGCAQILSLLPGTSRSGITLTAGLGVKLSRPDATRFALLLGIPTILGASVLNIYKSFHHSTDLLAYTFFVAGFISFVITYISIWWLMDWVTRRSLAPFVIYRVILGLTLMAFLILRS